MRAVRSIVLMAAAIMCAGAFCDTYTDGNGLIWTYSVPKNSDNATLTDVARSDGNALTGALVVPSSVNGKTVTTIAENSFVGLAIESLTLPDTLTTIRGNSSTGNGAFANCSALKSVNLGNGFVTITDGFANDSDNGANTNDPDRYAKTGAFGNCLSLEEVSFGSNILKIGAHAFSECVNLRGVDLPDSLQYIGENAFYHNKALASASFGPALVTVGKNAFYNCPELQTVVFRPCDTPLLTIGANAFAYAVKLASLTFSESLKVVGAGAFAGCTSLETLTLPNSLTTLRGNDSTGNGAFADCSALRSVNLGSGLATITDGFANDSDNGANTNDPDRYAKTGAFGNCLSLEEVSFGPNILKIGAHAFSECVNLRGVDLPDSLQHIGENAFYHNKALASASFGPALVTVGKNAFYNCPELQTVVFRPCDTPLLTIGANAFAYAVKLASLTFSESLKVVGAGAFAGCTSLETLTLPNSLTTLRGNDSTGNGAFAGCSALRSVNLGSGLATITDGFANDSDNGANKNDPDSYAKTGAFGKCLNLEEVAFGPNVVKIGAHAFSECQALKTLTFPDSLQFVGENCFYNNMRLTSVAFGADIRSIGKYAFMGCVSLKTATFSPATYPTLVISTGAFRNCRLLSSLSLSDALTTLESGAFAGCTLLRSLTMPSIISTVADNVFSDMDNLKEVTFLGLPPDNLANAGLDKDVKIRYSNDYKDDWAPIVESCGFTNAAGYDPESLKPPAPVIDPDTIEHRYALSTAQADRAIASITVNADCSINSFVLVNGMVYDSAVYIKNTATRDVKLTLPAGFTYKALKGTTPMTIPASTENILTITRIADRTFLVSREELVAAE